MAAVTAGIAAAGALASMYGANKNAQAQQEALNSQQAAQQQQLNFQREQYQRYLGLMGPIEQQLSTSAQSTQPLFYDQNAAAIKQNYGDTQRNIANSMGMRGIAGSGLDVGNMRGAAMGQAGALSQAYNQGLINRQNLGLTLTGRGQIQNAAYGMGQGLQGMANLYGQQANMYGNAAQQGWGGFQQGLQGLGQLYGQEQQRQQQRDYQNQYLQQLNMMHPSNAMGAPGTYNGQLISPPGAEAPFNNPAAGSGEEW